MLPSFFFFACNSFFSCNLLSVLFFFFLPHVFRCACPRGIEVFPQGSTAIAVKKKKKREREHTHTHTHTQEQGQQQQQQQQKHLGEFFKSKTKAQRVIFVFITQTLRLPSVDWHSQVQPHVTEEQRISVVNRKNTRACFIFFFLSFCWVLCLCGFSSRSSFLFAESNPYALTEADHFHKLLLFFFHFWSFFFLRYPIVFFFSSALFSFFFSGSLLRVVLLFLSVVPTLSFRFSLLLSCTSHRLLLSRTQTARR